MGKTSAKKIVIVVTSGPYDSLKPYTAVKFAEKARARGKDVKVIYAADGIHCVRKGVGRQSQTVANYEAFVKRMISKKITVEACRAPMKLYSMKEKDLIRGVKLAKEIFDDVTEDDAKVIWL